VNKILRQPRLSLLDASPTMSFTKSMSFEKKILAKRSELLGLCQKLLASQSNISCMEEKCISSAAKEIYSWKFKKRQDQKEMRSCWAR